jgi:hypothetical protein
MRYLILLIFIPPLLLGLLGTLFTSNKLDRMRQIRGWKPGATVQMKVVTQKYEDPENDACWIGFTNESIQRPGPHRVNLEPAVWDQLEIGNPIELIYLPGDPWPYTRNGIYASDGNFTFDYALLFVEIAMIVLSLLGAIGVLILLHVFRGKRKAATSLA